MIGSPRFDPTKIRIFFRITKLIINFAASMKKLIWYSMAVCLLTLCACGPSEADQKRAQRQRQEADRKAYQAAFKVGTLPTLDCLPLFLLRDSVLYDTTHHRMGTPLRCSRWALTRSVTQALTLRPVMAVSQSIWAVKPTRRMSARVVS